MDIKTKEKKLHGLVETPHYLTEQMLSLAPAEIYSDPNLKWLEPSAGAGAMVKVLIKKLDEGLKNIIPNDEERIIHIMNNMIYANEYNYKYYQIYKNNIDPDNKYNLHLAYTDYLSNDFEYYRNNVWNVDRFDVILTNPPYAVSNNITHKQSRKVWHLFVEKFLIKDLKEGGYLIAVHPENWRQPNVAYKRATKVLKEREMLELYMFTVKDGNKVFKQNTTFDIYCVRNKINTEFETLIHFLDGDKKLKIHKLPLIPNCSFDEIYDLIELDDE